MSDHAYTIASFGANKIDVEWLQHLIVIESPALVADVSEIEVHMSPIDDVLKVRCEFVPTLDAGEITQLDAIMSGYIGRPATAPHKGYWDDEDAAPYSTTSVHPTYHPCMDNTLTLDPGTYRVQFEVVCSVSTPGNGMWSRFQVNSVTVGNQDRHVDQDDEHKSSFTRETELVVATRGDYQLEIQFCKTSAWSGSAEIRDLKQVVERVSHQ